MVVIRLSKAGSTHRPFYHVVVTDSRKRRDSSYIERVGFLNYFAGKEEKQYDVDVPRIKHWVDQGAVLRPSVTKLVKRLEREERTGISERDVKAQKAAAKTPKHAPVAKVEEVKEPVAEVAAPEAKVAEKVAPVKEEAKVVEAKPEAKVAEKVAPVKEEAKVIEAKPEVKVAEKVAPVKEEAKVVEAKPEVKVAEKVAPVKEEAKVVEAKPEVKVAEKVAPVKEEAKVIEAKPEVKVAEKVAPAKEAKPEANTALVKEDTK